MLRAARSAIVMISHDRRFLENLSRTTLWLDRGKTRLLDDGFGAFEAWRDSVLDAEELERHKLDRRIVQEEHWLRYGVSARRKRNIRRLEALHQLRDRRKRSRAFRAQGGVKLTVQEAAEAGKKVIEARRISKSYGDLHIVRDFSIKIANGDRIGIVGPNGAGKTTLINLLTGAHSPDSGTVKLGVNLEIATLDQRREGLDPDMSLAATLTDGHGDSVIIDGKPRHVIGYMKDFLFKPDQARTPVKALSGGERGRLMLAYALSRPSNLLVLDEPTNDLDLETLELLQEMLASYPGTLLLVSHDRDFLDRTVTSVVAYEGDGKWIEYAGGYSDMVAQRGQGVQALNAKAKRAAPRSASSSPGATESAPRETKRKRLSPTEQHLLKTSPARIASLNDAIARLERSLADPDFYARDREGFAAMGAELAKRQAELEAAEEEWLRLELCARKSTAPELGTRRRHALDDTSMTVRTCANPANVTLIARGTCYG